MGQAGNREPSCSGCALRMRTLNGLLAQIDRQADETGDSASGEADPTR